MFKITSIRLLVCVIFAIDQVKRMAEAQKKQNNYTVTILWWCVESEDVVL